MNAPVVPCSFGEANALVSEMYPPQTPFKSHLFVKGGTRWIFFIPSSHPTEEFEAIVKFDRIPDSPRSHYLQQLGKGTRNERDLLSRIPHISSTGLIGYTANHQWFNQNGQRDALVQPYKQGNTLCELIDAAKHFYWTSVTEFTSNLRDVELPDPYVITPFYSISHIASRFFSLATDLATLHGQEIFHGDLTPANILLTPEETCMLDLGNSSTFEDFENPNLPHSGGTFVYDPTLLSSSKNQPTPSQTDIYGFGRSLLYACNPSFSLFSSVGIHTPFWDLSHGEFYRRGLRDEITFITERVSTGLSPFDRSFYGEYAEVLGEAIGGVPSPFERMSPLVARCLTLDHQERYTTATELAHDLKALMSTAGEQPSTTYQETQLKTFHLDTTFRRYSRLL